MNQENDMTENVPQKYEEIFPNNNTVRQQLALGLTKLILEHPADEVCEVYETIYDIFGE